MFSAAEHARFPKSGEKFARIGGCFARIRRDRARPHHASRSLKSEIKRRGEINIEPQSAAVFADNLAVLAKKFAIAGGKNIRSRGRRTQHIAKAVYAAALQINARKQPGRNAILAVAQQPRRLFDGLYVSRKQDHARRLQPREQGTEPRRHLRAVEAED